MKKVKLFIFFSLLTYILLGGIVSSKQVFAEEANAIYYIVSTPTNANEISGIIEEDTSYTDTTFIISDGISSAFQINNGALTLTNCTFQKETYGFIDQVITVGSNGSLRLENCVFENFENYNCAILNNGKVTIAETIFPKFGASIFNNSTLDESIIYESGDLYKVKLNSGYVTVTENTQIAEDVVNEITLGSSTFNENDTDIVNRLVVKGNKSNVFASRYIDNFTYSAKTNEWYLDYIGDITVPDDEASALKDSVLGKTLSAGDIVLTRQTLSFRNKDRVQIQHSAPYCTSFNYISENPTAIYRSGTRPLDNITPNMPYDTPTSSPIFSTQINNSGNKTNLTINSKISGSDTAEYTDTVSYPTGVDWSVFVDIPENTSLKDIKFYNSSNEITNGEIIGIDKEAVLSNNKYLKAIAKFNYYESVTYPTYNLTVDFIFESTIKYATISSVDIPNEMRISYPSEMLVGQAYKFEIPFHEDYKVTSILFNDTKVSLQKEDNSYYFETTVKEINTIKVNTIELPFNIEVTPTLTNDTFEYGDEIILTQNYTVEETGETITITYTHDEATAIGTYPLTGAISSSDDYTITIVGGPHNFNVTTKKVSLDTLTKVSVTREYSKTILSELSASDFFDSNTTIPSYLTPTLHIENTDLVINSNTLSISFVSNNTNYEIVGSKTVSVELIITPCEVSVAGATLTTPSQPLYYTGQAIELTVENFSSDAVNIKYTKYLISGVDKTEVSRISNAGSYMIEAAFIPVSDLYILDIENHKLTVEFTISKAKISLDTYCQSVENYYIEYDRDAHNIDLQAKLLPNTVTIKSVSSEESHIDVGNYTYTIYFEFDNENYSCIESTTSTLRITPRVLNISLKQSSFNYSGTAPSLELNITNKLEGDDVCITLNNANQIQAGTHIATVASVENTNYTVPTDLKLTYKINPIVHSLDGATYSFTPTTYDGKAHLPTFSGNLPDGVTYQIDNVTCKDVGTYNVKCSFVSTNINYLPHEPIYTKVVINKKPIDVIFECPESMVANGLEIHINIRFNNLVEGEELVRVSNLSTGGALGYTRTYSNSPINPGEYTCFVTLSPNSNYEISGAKKYDFQILSDNIRFYDEKITVLVESMFASDDSLVVTHNTNNVDIVNAMSKVDAKSYKSINLTYSSFTTDPVKVTIPLKDIVDNSEYLKIYKFQNGELVEIDYDIDNNVVIFSLNSSGDLIFVEEHSDLYKNRVLIIISSIVAALGVATGSTFIILHHKKKKKSKI